MRVSDFHYELPDALIARHPCAERTGSRLLWLDPARERPQHLQLPDIPRLLRAGDLLVFNDTRVIPARMFGCKPGTGGAVEVLVERLLDGRRVRAQLRASKAPKPGSAILLLDDEGREAARVRVPSTRCAGSAPRRMVPPRSSAARCSGRRSMPG